MGRDKYDVNLRTPQTYNSRPLANVAPDGELCHETLPVMRGLALDMHKGDKNLPFEEHRLLMHNEIVVGQSSDTSKPLVQGAFVDIVSTHIPFILAQGDIVEPFDTLRDKFIIKKLGKDPYEKLQKLAKMVPVDAWIEAVQAMNVKKLSQREDEFKEIRQTCIDNKLPFFLRSVASSGKSEFTPIDLEHIRSFADLARNQGLRQAGNHSWLVPILLPVLEYLDQHLDKHE